MKKFNAVLLATFLLHAEGAKENFFEQPKRMRTKERTSQKRQKCAEEIAEHLRLLAANTTLNGQLTEISLELIADELEGGKECAFQRASASDLDALYDRLIERNNDLREDNRKKKEDVCLLKKMNQREKSN